MPDSFSTKKEYIGECDHIKIREILLNGGSHVYCKNSNGLIIRIPNTDTGRPIFLDRELEISLMKKCADEFFAESKRQKSYGTL